MGEAVFEEGFVGRWASVSVSVKHSTSSFALSRRHVYSQKIDVSGVLS
jgi:hypothetical protein